MTRSSSRAPRVAAIALLLGSACINRGGEARPLYPGPPRPAGEVARLFGPIGTVDGKDVSRLGKSFALLPGCHLVKLAEKTGEINTLGNGGYVASLPPAVYAFRMQATHTYEIEVVLDATTGPTGEIRIRAWDRDATGVSTEISPIGSTAEIDDCMKGQP
jgi:hypothetical protein